MKWVTREKAKVDRIACPWLIKKFVDKNPTFLYVDGNSDWDKLQKELGDAGFVYDVPNCILGHHGNECSFDAIIKHFKINDPALDLMAKMVRSADTSDKSHAVEGFGLEAIADGFRRISKDDFHNQKMQFPVYDAIYAYCVSKTTLND